MATLPPTLFEIAYTGWLAGPHTSRDSLVSVFYLTVGPWDYRCANMLSFMQISGVQTQVATLT